MDDIQDDEIILDIGDNTIKNICEMIDKSNTVLWNGPAGYFENDIFSKGTNYIDQLRKNLDRQNPDAVIINIPLSHPLLSINGLGISSVNAINSFLN